MFKYLSVVLLFLVGNVAYCAEHHAAPAPAPHHAAPAPHVEHHAAPAPTPHAEHHAAAPAPRAEHPAQQERVEHREAERHERVEHREAEHHERAEHREGERHEARHEALERRESWDHCRGGRWEEHGGCHRWSCTHIVFGGDFGCYRGIFEFRGGICVFPPVVFDFGIDLPAVVEIDGTAGHYELRQQDVVITEAVVVDEWVAPTFGIGIGGVRVIINSGHWAKVTHPAVIEKRECRVWVAD